MNLFLLHLSIVTYFAGAWYRLLQIPYLNITDKRLIQIESLSCRYLTNWNFAFQTFFFIGYLCHDVLEIVGMFTNLKKLMKKLLDFLFISIVAPLSIFVSVTFWGVYFYDRELSYPKIVDAIMPQWVNHALHTVIVVNVFLQAYFNKTPTKSLSKSIISLTILKMFYCLCIYETYFERKLWIYPFLGAYHEPMRLFILTMLCLVSLGIGVTFHYANNTFCRKCEERSSQEPVHQKKKTK